MKKLPYGQWLQQYVGTGSELDALAQFVAHFSPAYPKYNQQTIKRLVLRSCRTYLIEAYQESYTRFIRKG